MEWLVFMICLSLSLASPTTLSPTSPPTPPSPPPCPSAPTHAQPADLHYKLSISGDPDLFLPGELYTLSLQGVNSGQGPTPFTGFTIWAEIVEEPKENASLEISSTSPPFNMSLGGFQSYDAHTKLREFCNPAVENSTAHTKTEIQVIWSAPTEALSSCVRICARVSPNNTAVQSFLARKMCPAPAAPASFSRQPPIVEPCCACDEAKYEVTFEGLWSRNTHPRGFPPESARAHFGDVIGASHTAQYRVWQEGRVASSGLRRLADDGVTTALEKELKAESDHIRTIIKARGISWQQVVGAGVPSTLAVFRVDAKHHLVSLASKLAPSPDWIVGVSALELCNANCSWRGALTLPLYPYDAGTDNGIGYTTPRDPTLPPTVVRALRPDWPRDARSPFYSATGDMRPFARLRLTRLRLYEKSCDSSEPLGEVSVDTASSPAGACATLSWGAWGPCSVTCGRGRASRQRHYARPARAYAEACRAQLTDYKTCRGPRWHCRVISEYEPDGAERSGPCAVSAWSAWSACAACGVRMRGRHYLAARAHKRCHLGFRASTPLSQARPCDAGPCQKPPKGQANGTNFDWFYRDVPGRGECPVTSWGEWSPCSARCGRGRRLRTRLHIARDSRVQDLLSRTMLLQWNQRFAELQNIEVPTANLSTSDPEVEKQVQQHLERCQFTLTQQEALCDGEYGYCINASRAQEVCALPLMVGHCRTYEERWFHDANQSVCEPFGYTGCGGNENNFRAREDCLQVCGQDKTTEAPPTTVALETGTKKLKPTPLNTDNEVLLNDSPAVEPAAKDENCKMGPWTGWGNCLGHCKSAVRLSYRVILRPATGAGKPCARLVKKKSCVPKHCHILIK